MNQRVSEMGIVLRFQNPDLTVGDVGVALAILTNDAALESRDLQFEFTKPSGSRLVVDDDSVSGMTTVYVTRPGDVDEVGDWKMDLYDKTSGMYYLPQVILRVRPSPAGEKVASEASVGVSGVLTVA